MHWMQIKLCCSVITRECKESVFVQNFVQACKNVELFCIQNSILLLHRSCCAIYHCSSFYHFLLFVAVILLLWLYILLWYAGCIMGLILNTHTYLLEQKCVCLWTICLEFCDSLADPMRKVTTGVGTTENACGVSFLQSICLCVQKLWCQCVCRKGKVQSKLPHMALFWIFLLP